MGIDGGDEFSCGIAYLAARFFQKSEAGDPIGWRHEIDGSVETFYPLNRLAVELLKGADEIVPNMRLWFSVHDTLTLPLESA
jgi:hypothetical protein